MTVMILGFSQVILVRCERNVIGGISDDEIYH
nr:MAG TPA: hypothetical protein [Caudoviricetes sp.]